MECYSIYNSTNPIANLCKFDSNLPESVFGDSFTEYYFKNYSKIHSRSRVVYHTTIREFPIYNLGISDMVSIVSGHAGMEDNTNRYCDFISKNKFTVRAFEFKLKDWRKGLLQAYRYKMYSHCSILVVPINTFNIASKALDTFKSLNVGLWGYNEESETLRKAYTPRPANLYNDKYFNIFKSKAIKHLSKSQPTL